MAEDLFNVIKLPPLERPTLVVGWLSQDAGKVSSRVLSFLLDAMDAEEIAELDLPDFFSFDGALFRDNIVTVPESKFWASQQHNTLFLLSDEPDIESFRFLNGLIDFSHKHFKTSRIFTVNGAASFVSHYSQPNIMTVYNQENLKDYFADYNMLTPMDWEGPPALSSYLLWVAQRRQLPGVSFWSEVPFYLAAVEDPRAVKAVLSLFSNFFGLELNLDEFDKKIEKQQEMLEHFIETNPEIKEIIDKIKSDYPLTEDEQVRLSTETYKLFS